MTEEMKRQGWNPQPTQHLEVVIKLDPALERRLEDILLALVRPIIRSQEKIMATVAELHQNVRDLIAAVDRLITAVQAGNTDEAELQDMMNEVTAERDKANAALPVV